MSVQVEDNIQYLKNTYIRQKNHKNLKEKMLRIKNIDRPKGQAGPTQVGTRTQANHETTGESFVNQTAGAKPPGPTGHDRG